MPYSMRNWDINTKIDLFDLGIESDKDIEIVMHYEFESADPEVGIMRDSMCFRGWDFKSPSDMTDELKTAIDNFIYTMNLDIKYAEEAEEDRDGYIEFCRFGSI